MPATTAAAALRWLLDEGHPRVTVTFFGGEPLLEREMVLDSWPRLRILGSATGVVTAGM